MRQLTLSTVCVIAALAAGPSLAAAEGKPGGRAPAGNTECTHTPSGKSDGTASARTPAKDREMDCIVVKGYPSQDGRATLRRSLEKEAKEGLGKAFQFNLKDLIGKKRTS